MTLKVKKIDRGLKWHKMTISVKKCLGEWGDI
jgi:hypothetical protein